MSSKILYVDDESDLRDLVDIALGLHPDLELRTCASGAEALKAVAEWRPDLLLLDVMMPGMDGPQTLNALKAAGHQVPSTVFLTARTGSEDIARLMALGARDVIAKPFDALALADRLRGYIDGE